MSTSRLFGGRVRAETLETLASTSKPLSAYHLAKVIGAQPIQVLGILKALPPGLVRHTHNGWSLTNDHLRHFIRDELRREELEHRQEKDELLIGLGFRPRRAHGRQ
ncbi:MAG: hypothetical protein L3K23_01005 [Thermoplasmata archaeon]|nr:hypothetical protein [Thermoplasmata archaeon]